MHTLSCTKSGWSTITHDNVIRRALLRPLRECQTSTQKEDVTPFRSSVQSGRGSNPLRMDVTVQEGDLFRGHPLHGKKLLLDLTVVNPSAASNIDREAANPGSLLRDAATKKRNKYRGTHPDTYCLLPVAVSMHGALGDEAQMLIEAMATRLVDLKGLPGDSHERPAAEGRKASELRRRFSFVLQQALSQRTRHHLCRQGVFSMESGIQTWEPEEAHNEQTPSELTTSQQGGGEDESRGYSSDTTLSIQISEEDQDDGGVEETKGVSFAERGEDSGNTDKEEAAENTGDGGIPHDRGAWRTSRAGRGSGTAGANAPTPTSRRLPEYRRRNTSTETGKDDEEFYIGPSG